MSDTGEEDLTPQLEWIKFEEEMAKMSMLEESKLDRFKRKFKENPFVPLGALATTGAITYGIYNMYTGNSKMQQLMMRYRVGFQFFTICVLVGGFALNAPKNGSDLGIPFSTTPKDT